MTGQSSAPCKTLELLADEVADGARNLLTISNVTENIDFSFGSLDIPPIHFAQAPACRLGALARAAVEDGAQPTSLRDAAKVHHSHGERDAHRLFDKYWMSLKVQIDEILIGPLDGGEHVKIPHYKVPGPNELGNHYSQFPIIVLILGNYHSPSK